MKNIIIILISILVGLVLITQPEYFTGNYIIILGLYIIVQSLFYFISLSNMSELTCISKWNLFDNKDYLTGPKKYGKYLICRKDGKIHWETWNGTGWAYNHNEIIYWGEIISPLK